VWRMTGLAMGLVALLGLIMGLVAFRLITRPLRALADTVRAFDATGDAPVAPLDPPPDDGRRDETTRSPRCEPLSRT